jgi:hypothetical protein
MDQTPTSSDIGYSPDLSGELTLHGQRFALAAMGPNGIVVRSPRAMEPGRGTIRMIIDGRQTVYNVDLWLGIDPAKREQVFRLLTAAEVVA